VAWTARELVDTLGGHPAGALGIDPTAAGGAERWLVAALVLGARGRAEAATAAARALAKDGLAEPRDVAAASPEQLVRLLAEAGLADPERAASVLRRACAALVERFGGSCAGLARDADGLEELGGRIAALAPGVGPAAVARFLRPLRDVFAAAADLPLSPAARAAAECVGLLACGGDEAGGPGALRAALAAEADAPTLTDTEHALDALGRRACLRGRADRCPLKARCPRRAVARPGQRE